MTSHALSPTPREIRIKRMSYRSWHRGCKETDIILGHFADHHLATLSDDALDLFERFLEEQDADIWKWLTGEAHPCDAAYQPLLQQLSAYSTLVKI